METLHDVLSVSAARRDATPSPLWALQGDLWLPLGILFSRVFFELGIENLGRDHTGRDHLIIGVVRILLHLLLSFVFIDAR